MEKPSRPITDGFTAKILNFMQAMATRSPGLDYGPGGRSKRVNNNIGRRMPAGTKMIRRAEKSMIGRTVPLGIAGQSLRQMGINRNLAIIAQRNAKRLAAASSHS